MRGFLTVLLLSGGLAIGAIAAPALAEEPPPCGCGGPKAFFAQKYGTVVPPTAPGAASPTAEAPTAEATAEDAPISTPSAASTSENQPPAPPAPLPSN